MVLSDTVDENELLYRVVKRSRRDCLTQKNKATAALFKDSNGVSVDRDGGREQDAVINFIIENSFPRRAKGVAELSAFDCFKFGTEVKSDSTEANPYHANILLNENEQIRNVQALQLADKCKIIYFNEDMDWVDL